MLVCKIISRCFRTAAVQFVVEDPGGNVAPVALYHLPARWTCDDLNDEFPQGATYGRIL